MKYVRIDPNAQPSEGTLLESVIRFPASERAMFCSTMVVYGGTIQMSHHELMQLAEEHKIEPADLMAWLNKLHSPKDCKRSSPGLLPKDTDHYLVAVSCGELAPTLLLLRQSQDLSEEPHWMLAVVSPDDRLVSVTRFCTFQESLA